MSSQRQAKSRSGQYQRGCWQADGLPLLSYFSLGLETLGPLGSWSYHKSRKESNLQVLVKSQEVWKQSPREIASFLIIGWVSRMLALQLLQKQHHRTLCNKGLMVSAICPDIWWNQALHPPPMQLWQKWDWRYSNYAGSPLFWVFFICQLYSNRQL